MLKRITKRTGSASGARFAIVASQYNGRYVDAMLMAAKAELRVAGVRTLNVVRVPGAFEIPSVAAALASQTRAGKPRYAAVICLGVIFQGQTSHAEHIGWGVTHALAQIQIQRQLPVIHGVFVFTKEAHARVRCLGRKHNRGTEAARTALTMAEVMRGLER
ncbi:MAG TPA: 6,7-dimethyl-8-ribityllumazine synthase [Verrucomicrobiae bacterium]|nr:6,7-dimethyl-8-ribityllumazine synthase [Verrucomicrobiae bacterium]